MTRRNWMFVCVICGLTLMAGRMSAQEPPQPLPESLPRIEPGERTAAAPKPAPSPVLTPAEHLARAAEHLQAAGQPALAEHVRQLAGQSSVPASGTVMPVTPSPPPASRGPMISSAPKMPPALLPNRSPENAVVPWIVPGWLRSPVIPAMDQLPVFPTPDSDEPTRGGAQLLRLIRRVESSPVTTPSTKEGI